MRKLHKKQGFVLKLLVTDKLRSYASAFRRLRLTCCHEQGLRRNNRPKNSHQAVRPGFSRSLFSGRRKAGPGGCGRNEEFGSYSDISAGFARAHVPPDSHTRAKEAFTIYAGIEQALQPDRMFLVSNDVTLADICFAAELSLFSNERTRHQALEKSGLELRAVLKEIATPEFG